jgi:hypothetical protein
MPISAKRFKGKLKRDIADEAFSKIGPNAIAQVDAYFQKHYKISHCERSMYQAAKRRAKGKPGPVKRRYRATDRKDIAGIVARIRQLAHDVGGYDQLTEIISALTDGT